MTISKTTRRIGLAALLAATALGAGGLTTGAGAQAPAAQMVDDFRLPDQNYLSHQLYRKGDAKAVVLITYASGDATVKTEAAAYMALKAASPGVEVYMLDSRLGDRRETVIPEAKAAGLTLPILFDYEQLVGEQLGVTRAGEVIVIDPRTWTVAWRGPVAGPAGETWAREAIEAVSAGKPVAVPTHVARGGVIAFPERGKAHGKISYAATVAPIIQAKCTGCHQPGGIGPMPLNTYEQVKGFSPMIREVLRTDRMPPWNVDPHVSKFADDKSLTPSEIKTVVHWIEQGAPRDGATDPMAVAAKKRVVQEFPLGKPDLVLALPTYKIPASGVVDYQRPIVVNPLTEGKWVKASTYVVNQRQAVHHFLSGYLKDIPADGKGNESRWGASMGGYAVGAESTLWPKNVGTYLPPGGAIGFQAHYTPFGKEVTDASKIGLYFYKDGEKPDLVMRNSVVVDNTIVIPPGEARHKETAYLNVPKDMLLYSAFPHAHYRGYASDFWVQYPDGTKKLLLAMPRYDFNWQREYTFAEPLKIPAGSKLIAHYWYDNSKQNPANPDASKKIVWGDQSWEEMFYTAIRYRWTEETSTKLTNYDELMDQTRLLAMLDDDMDGKIEKAEFKGELGDKLSPYFAQMDQDKSGGVENAELMAALKVMGGGRRRDQAAQVPAAPAPTPPAAKAGGGR